MRGGGEGEEEGGGGVGGGGGRREGGADQHVRRPGQDDSSGSALVRLEEGAGARPRGSGCAAALAAVGGRPGGGDGGGAGGSEADNAESGHLLPDRQPAPIGGSWEVRGRGEEDACRGGRDADVALAGA